MQIERLRQFRSTSPVLSAYLDQTDAPSQSASARLGELFKKIDLTGMPREAARSLRASMETIDRMADRIDAEPAPGVGIFAAAPEDLVEYVPLHGKVWDIAMAGRRPYLRPMWTSEVSYRSAIVVLDGRRSVLFCHDGVRFEHYGEVIEEGVRKANFGGFAGYAEHNVRRHAAEVVQKHWRATADLLLQLFQERGFDFLFIGGHQRHVEEFTGFLHPYVAGRVAGTFIIDPHTMTDALVREMVDPLETKANQEREAEDLRTFYDTVASGGNGVLGLPRVIAAVNIRAIERLHVVGSLPKPGKVCPSCGWLGLVAETCPICGATMDRTVDVIDEVMEATVDSGGTILATLTGSDAVEGIGATLRYRIPDMEHEEVDAAKT